jgi:cobalamin biosynthesis Mg chelatase CobN
MAETTQQTLDRLAAERNAQLTGSSSPTTTSDSGWLSFLGQSLGLAGNIYASRQSADQQQELTKAKAKLAAAQAQQASATRPLIIGIVAVVVAVLLVGVLVVMRKGK